MNENETANETNDVDLDDVFSKRHTVKVDKEDIREEKKLPEEVKKVIPAKKAIEASEPEEDEEEEQSVKAKDIDYKSEYEKAEKRNKDAQKAFHEDRKKLAAYTKAVNKLKEEGSLLDEEAENLLNHTKYESEPDEENQYTKYSNIWAKETQYMRKYAPNPKDIEQNIMAFEHFMQTSPISEVEEVMKDLERYEDDEIELTRHMLEFGRQYNEDVFADIQEVGSVRGLKDKYSQNEAKLQKELDKLQSRYDKLKSKYEDYDTEPANLRLPSGSSSRNDLPKNVIADVDAIFDNRFRRR